MVTSSLVNSLQIICNFKTWALNINTVTAPSKEYFECELNYAQLKDRFEEVTVKTVTNTKTNNDVELVEFYNDNTVKFIPNIIFKTFPNCSYFYIHHNFKLEEIEKSYFSGALKLKTLWIASNDISQLDKRVFSLAPNIEIINMQGNKIENFHKLAFDGLKNLQQIYLQSNRIHEISIGTFTAMTNLKVLDLSDNYCTNRKYQGDFQGLEECDLQEKINAETLKASKLAQSIDNLKYEGDSLRNLIESVKKNEMEPVKTKSIELTSNVDLLIKNMNSVNHSVTVLQNESKIDNNAKQQLFAHLNERFNDSLSELASMNENLKLLNQTQQKFNENSENALQVLSEKIQYLENDLILLKKELLTDKCNMEEKVFAKIKESIENINETIYSRHGSCDQVIASYMLDKESIAKLKDEVPQLSSDFYLFMYFSLASIALFYLTVVFSLVYAFKVSRVQQGYHQVRYSVDNEKTQLSIDQTAGTWAH